MWVSDITLHNIKGFANLGPLRFSKGINLLVGPNNGGKSTIIKTLAHMQWPGTLGASDVRRGPPEGEAVIVLEDIDESILLASPGAAAPRPWFIRVRLQVTPPSSQSPVTMEIVARDGTSAVPLPWIRAEEPHNFAFMFLSRRKVTMMNEQVNLDQSRRVSHTFDTLPIRLDRVTNPNSSGFDAYRDGCKDTLGFAVTGFETLNGKNAGYWIDDNTHIALTDMGEGVTNLVGLIRDLAAAGSGKLFLLEEPENDIHPQALKALLRLIIQKAETNQFIVSTHSNIVTRYLGSVPGSKIFRVQSEIVARMPTSRCEEVPDTKDAHWSLLEELGYEFSDLGLPNAWLIMEEASAERIVRDFLVPQFFPQLTGKLQTVAANGVDDAKVRFIDFHRLFTFVHRQDGYKNRAWVLLDGDPAGRQVTTELKEKYANSWPPQTFRNLSQPAFERYYPARFGNEIDEALALTNGPVRQEKKRALLEKVLVWIASNPEEARREFEASAADVLSVLREFAEALGVLTANASSDLHKTGRGRHLLDNE